jgi:hypothetical protein
VQQKITVMAQKNTKKEKVVLAAGVVLKKKKIIAWLWPCNTKKTKRPMTPENDHTLEAIYL